jgi:hypothetical protein
MTRLAALGGICLCLASCAPDIGDLGRPRPSVLNDTIYPTVGSFAALARGEQVSFFHLTDDEQELRNRAWRFIMPAHERSWFLRQLQELARTRILPVSAQDVDPRSYFAALTSGSFRSEYSRYRRLAEDATADAQLIPAFRQAATRVAASDVVRMRVAETSPAIEPPKPERAAARVAENEGLVAWVRERLRHRVASYRWALDNLVVEMPAREAIMAERAILLLEAELGRIEALTPTVFPAKPMIAKG